MSCRICGLAFTLAFPENDGMHSPYGCILQLKAEVERLSKPGTTIKFSDRIPEVGRDYLYWSAEQECWQWDEWCEWNTVEEMEDLGRVYWWLFPDEPMEIAGELSE